MVTQYKSFLEKDDILEFVNKKFQHNKNVEEVLYTDPYYRFIRIIELINQLGIPVKKEDRWLDLGCHHGQFLRLVKHNFNCSLTGMDDWNLKAAMPFTDFDYHAVNLAEAEWPEKVTSKIKFVSALEVIEHIIDTEQFLKQIKGVLADDGYLILSTPNISCLRNRVMVPFGSYPAFMEYKNRIHHVRLFNKNTLEKLLEDEGFLVEKCIGVSFLPEKALKYKAVRKFSELLANVFPSLCGNLVVVAKKRVQ